MIFQYEAIDSSGQRIQDLIEASDMASARNSLRAKQLYVVRISADRQQDGGKEAGTLSRLYRVVEHQVSLRLSQKETGIFTRQLATLLKAGLPLVQALNDIVDQVENRTFRVVLTDVKNRLEEGTSFSVALSRHPLLFSEMYVNMVRVGENLGSLDEVLERLAESEEKKNLLKSRVRSALWYPAFMFTFSLVVVTFLLVSIIPTIADMFREQHQNLPLPTEIVMAISSFMSNFWYILLILIVVGIYFFRRYYATEEGRKRVDEWKMKVPVFRSLYMKLVVYRFTQNLGILLANHVDIIRSFDIVEKIVDNRIIEEKISSARSRIQEGASVATALQKNAFLPRLVIGMITAGEASDRLADMLLNIGKVYEEEIDMTVASITSLIEPVIIIFMGFAIGMIVLSVMLPIMEMNFLVQ